MSTHFRVTHGAATTPRRVTVDGRQADSVGIPRGRNGEGRRAPYIHEPAATTCSLGAEAFVPRGGDDLRLQGHLDDLDADTWLWRIPDGRHCQVARFHVLACLSEILGPYL